MEEQAQTRISAVLDDTADLRDTQSRHRDEMRATWGLVFVVFLIAIVTFLKG